MARSWNCSVTWKHTHLAHIQAKTHSDALKQSFIALPLVISLLSVSPPHREMATWGRSPICSHRLSTPLSIPLLATDWGDWLALRTPSIIISESPLTELLPPSLRTERKHTQRYKHLCCCDEMGKVDRCIMEPPSAKRAPGKLKQQQRSHRADCR